MLLLLLLLLLLSFVDFVVVIAVVVVVIGAVLVDQYLYLLPVFAVTTSIRSSLVCTPETTNTQRFSRSALHGHNISIKLAFLLSRRHRNNVLWQTMKPTMNLVQTFPIHNYMNQMKCPYSNDSFLSSHSKAIYLNDQFGK